MCSCGVDSLWAPKRKKKKIPNCDYLPLLQLLLPLKLLVGDVVVVLVRLDDQDEVDDDVRHDGQEAEGGGGHGQVPAQLPVQPDLGNGDVLVQESDDLVDEGSVDSDGHGEGDQGQDPGVEVACQWIRDTNQCFALTHFFPRTSTPCYLSWS